MFLSALMILELFHLSENCLSSSRSTFCIFNFLHKKNFINHLVDFMEFSSWNFSAFIFHRKFNSNWILLLMQVFFAKQNPRRLCYLNNKISSILHAFITSSPSSSKNRSNYYFVSNPYINYKSWHNNTAILKNLKMFI